MLRKPSCSKFSYTVSNPHNAKYVLQNLIARKKYFTLDSLNAKIDTYNYGNEAKNKPSTISKHKLTNDHDKKPRQNGKDISHFEYITFFLLFKLPER